MSLDLILELIAIGSGILSVWFSKKEHVLVYPVGLISTAIYIYISWKYQLIGEASVNFYYTIMSIIGWALWLKKDRINQTNSIQVTISNRKDWIIQITLFSLLFVSFFILLNYFKNAFFEGVIPFADSFATATAFTGMYLMVHKKVESWYWWIATNIASIPLYYVKGLWRTSCYYTILLVLAFYGLTEWQKKAQINSGNK